MAGREVASEHLLLPHSFLNEQQQKVPRISRDGILSPAGFKDRLCVSLGVWDGRCQTEHPHFLGQGRTRPLSLAEREPGFPLKMFYDPSHLAWPETQQSPTIPSPDLLPEWVV